MITGMNAERGPELEIALDMLRRSMFFAVPLLGFGAWFAGWAGFASAALALGLVLVNLLLGAVGIGFGARIGGSVMMAMVLGGYLLHLGIVTAAVLPIRHHSWFAVVPFAVALLVAHIGLLIVEVRHVAASAAFPGLKPGHGFGTRRSRSTHSTQDTQSTQSQRSPGLVTPAELEHTP